ncbi:serine decarboxylase-like [Prosopis cineraria]|uniref:serine decarboxylase-like n=1 Tax=Prosopis cineraria TaxID=364024 RepID=UPI00240FEEFE|nr:serine decarboxylase-like [Prosopis cineraria]
MAKKRSTAFLYSIASDRLRQKRERSPVYVANGRARKEWTALLYSVARDLYVDMFSLKQCRLCVLNWFAKLWEIEKSEYWGYVTNGGTEGNLYGILLGRELYPDGVLYISKESHYSLLKIARISRVKCVIVGTRPSGEIDYDELKASLLAHQDKPAIVNLNLGTTIKGGIDDLDLVPQILKDCGFTQERFYIQCDAALFGMMLPFINGALQISFKKPIGSVTVSGHKFLGCPIPCGVLITHLNYVELLSREVEYIASRDTAISGSQGGHASIFLWYVPDKRGFNGLQDVNECINKAIYLQNCLKGYGIGVMLNKFSNIIVFERPLDDAFGHKWILVNEGKMSGIVVLQHVTMEMLDSFVTEFVENPLIWYQDNEGKKAPCIAKDICAKNCACSSHKKLIS